jgi:formate-dependent phosphoribosylglycinamide formyltransferase (GAR transformylase)
MIRLLLVIFSFCFARYDIGTVTLRQSDLSEFSLQINLIAQIPHKEG